MTLAHRANLLIPSPFLFFFFIFSYSRPSLYVPNLTCCTYRGASGFPRRPSFPLHEPRRHAKGVELEHHLVIALLVLLLDNLLEILEQNRPELPQQPVVVEAKEARNPEASLAPVVVLQSTSLEVLVHRSVEHVPQEETPKLIKGVHLRRLLAWLLALVTRALLEAAVPEVPVAHLDVPVLLEESVGGVAKVGYLAMRCCVAIGVPAVLGAGEHPPDVTPKVGGGHQRHLLPVLRALRLLLGEHGRHRVKVVGHQRKGGVLGIPP
mmetsp:Transcript_5070/g.18304  ORF Transcript_5070/g.18304 Transcript_5070/m.18304 type:complete len:265 (-) Transcript_5070:2007-2801(-)